MHVCMCVCICVCVCVSVMCRAFVYLGPFVCLFVVHCCVDGVGVFVGMLVCVDIRVFMHVVVNLSIMRLVVCFEVRLRMSRYYCM